VVTVWPQTMATAYAVKRCLCLAGACRRVEHDLHVFFLPAATEKRRPRRLEALDARVNGDTRTRRMFGDRALLR
jgi:hypothetical protein